MILQLLPATSLQEHATFLWTLITLMIAVNSLQGLSTAGPGKIDTQTQSPFKYTAADQTHQYLHPQADFNGSDWLTIIQFNHGTNRSGFTFDPSTILIG